MITPSSEHDANLVLDGENLRDGATAPAAGRKRAEREAGECTDRARGPSAAGGGSEAGTHEMPRMGSLWPTNAFRLFMLACQYLMMPLLSAVTSQSVLGLQVMARMGESWACAVVAPAGRHHGARTKAQAT